MFYFKEFLTKQQIANSKKTNGVLSFHDVFYARSLNLAFASCHSDTQKKFRSLLIEATVCVCVFFLFMSNEMSFLQKKAFFDANLIKIKLIFFNTHDVFYTQMQ